MNRLKEKYTKEVVPSLMEKFEYSSVMQVPKVEKIVINMGVGDAVQNAKMLDNAVEELTLISGQKPVVTRAKKSIAGFRLRPGARRGQGHARRLRVWPVRRTWCPARAAGCTCPARRRYRLTGRVFADRKSVV